MWLLVALLGVLVGFWIASVSYHHGRFDERSNQHRVILRKGDRLRLFGHTVTVLSSDRDPDGAVILTVADRISDARLL